MGILTYGADYLAKITAWGTPLMPQEAANALHVASGYKAETPEIWPLNMNPGEVRDFPYATVRAELNEDGVSRSYRVTRKLEYMVGSEVGEAEPDRELGEELAALRHRPAVAAEMIHYLGTVTAIKTMPDDREYLMVRDLLTGAVEPVNPDTVRIAPDARDKARDLARAGMSGPNIAEETGRPLRTIQRWCGDLLPGRGGKRLPDGAQMSRATRYRRAAEAHLNA